LLKLDCTLSARPVQYSTSKSKHFQVLVAVYYPSLGTGDRECVLLLAAVVAEEERERESHQLVATATTPLLS
jgi:hypothetical protein